jgi:DNA-binding transcriptional MerR regulator
MTVSERGYLSIGEVLALLQEEFPDVTISKIRFLESQGLIEPERKASGYRKFYGVDVERLRFILREQRENYLPLRVIRDRLDAAPGDDEADALPLGPAEPAPPAPDALAPADIHSPAAHSPAHSLGDPSAEHVPVWMRKAPPGVARPAEHDRLSHPSLAGASTPPALQLVLDAPAAAAGVAMTHRRSSSPSTNWPAPRGSTWPW